MTGPPVLEISALTAGYGRVQVVNEVSMSVSGGEVVAVVGRNGAGKTTTLSAVAGLRYGPTAGTVVIDGTDVSNSSAHEIVNAGLNLVPEGRRIFREMTVSENLRLGAFTRRRSGRARSRLTWPGCTSCSRPWSCTSPRSSGSSRAASSRWWPSARSS